ncbi:DUF3667 domain-containing protein [uncultured Acetobacteroides sp.]|uniref:DUF3667 domain-containing protein n=1 Tax=uncultured Acetobacteroides sp. TaxID=1760811 RepID=UPI0029F5A10E|nr:DUF3667 domain-containing protein [uncultured Acetobacteroides sp.]
MFIRAIRYKILKAKRRHRQKANAKPPYTHCKNCGEELHGMYCSKCGQYASEANRPFVESVRFYLEHHYGLDRKLGTSLRHLFLKPGFLAREYMEGRIERHVHPFKLYLFASILLFGVMIPLTQSSREGKTSDSKPFVDTTRVADRREALSSDTASAHQKVEPPNAAFIDKGNDSSMSRLERQAKKNLTGVSRKEILQKFVHYLSLSVIFLMPVFALLLMIIYRGRERYYLGHLILSVHQHVVLFFAISLSLIWEKLISANHPIGIWLFWATFVYFVLSLARFYREKIIKSLMKAFLLLFLYLIICSIAIVAVGVLVIMI